MSAESTSRELRAGELTFIDLVPGSQAEARFEFSEAVRFGRRTRHLTVPVTGGLAGLVLDLRDVPLRCPNVAIGAARSSPTGAPRRLAGGRTMIAPDGVAPDGVAALD